MRTIDVEYLSGGILVSDELMVKWNDVDVDFLDWKDTVGVDEAIQFYLNEVGGEVVVLFDGTDTTIVTSMANAKPI